jgi:hypothetical protein
MVSMMKAAEIRKKGSDLLCSASLKVQVMPCREQGKCGRTRWGLLPCTLGAGGGSDMGPESWTIGPGVSTEAER